MSPHGFTVTENVRRDINAEWESQRDGEQLDLTPEVETPKRKRARVRDTSRTAAERVVGRSEGLRAVILEAIVAAARDPQRQGATADEVHEAIASTEAERLDVRRLMHVRRRISDLHNLQRIKPTLLQRVNAGGNPMIVWAPVEVSDAD